MQKRFIGNLALLIFINLLIKPFWVLGIDRAVQNTVGSETYGLYYALFNFSFLFSMVLDAGITGFNTKNIAQHRQLLSKYFPNIILIKSFLLLAYLFISFAAAFLIGYRGQSLYFLLLLGFNQILSSFILYLRSNLTALHLFTTDSLLSALDKLLMIAFIIPLLYGNLLAGPFRIEWFIYVQSIALLLTAITVWVIVSAKTGKLRFRLKLPLLGLIMRQSYPYALLIILMTLYNKVDSVMLERILPDGAFQSGIYASAYRLLDAVNMLAFLFAGLLLPMFATLIKQKEPVNDLVKLSFSLLMVPSFILSACCFVYSTEIMQWLNRETTAYSAGIFSLLMFSYVAIANTYIFGTLLTANGDLRFLNKVALACLFLNIALNLLLIPQYKALGACTATLLTQCIVTGFHVSRSYKQLHIRFSPAYLLRLMLFIPLLFVIGYGLKMQLDNWMLAGALSIFAGLFIAVLAKLIPLKAILKIISVS